jgi:hypothetical protein
LIFLLTNLACCLVTKCEQGNPYEPVENLIVFRLIKNAQMQGARDPEE